MAEPTLYFPENVYYRLGFKDSRLWNTSKVGSPHGRTQARKRWLRPKRQMQAVIYPTPDRGYIVSPGPYPALTAEDFFGIQVRPFLNLVAGRFRSFYIFNPKRRYFLDYPVGLWNGGGLPLPVTFPLTYPFILPLRGDFFGLANAQTAELRAIKFVTLDGLTAYDITIDDFTLDHAGPGQETQLVTYAPVISPVPPSGTYNMSITGYFYERIPAVMTSDLDDFQFDWANANPDTEFAIDIEEDFG